MIGALNNAFRRAEGGRSELDGGGEEAGALVPLELALDELEADEGGGAEVVGLVLELDEAFVEGLIVDAFDAGVDDAELGCSGR